VFCKKKSGGPDLAEVLQPATESPWWTPHFLVFFEHPDLKGGVVFDIYNAKINIMLYKRSIIFKWGYIFFG
jgi:hypothetical protein